MKKTAFLFVCVFAFLAGAIAFAQDEKSSNIAELDGMLDKEGKIFETKADDFITKDRRIFFKWNSAQKENARAPAYKNTPDMKLFGFRVWECLVRFKDGQLSKFCYYLYNRGDAGSITNERFKIMLKEIKAKVGEWTGAEGGQIRKKKVNRNIAYSQSWTNDEFVFALKWSSSGKRSASRPEYIKLVVSKFDADVKKGKSGRVKVAQKEDLKANIIKNEQGDVYIKDIPMVDQGAKGYCAVATTERILRYYGLDVDQHQIAQLADSSASGGTSRLEMLKALKKAGTKFRIKIKELQDDNSFDSWGNFKKFIKKYNKFAKKADVTQFNPKQAVSGNKYSPNVFVQSVDYEFYKKTKLTDKGGFKRFKKNIHKFIGMGVPLAWSLMTGVYKDPSIPQQSISGHMRLIIGYNDKEGEIIFSDSWGAKHAFKKMKYEDAWTITTGTLYFLPRKNRR